MRTTARPFALTALVAFVLLAIARPDAAQAPSTPQDPEGLLAFRRVPPLCPLFSLSIACESRRLPPPTWNQFEDGRVEATNQAALALVRRAYGIDHLSDEFVDGGPRWLRTELYDVTGMVDIGAAEGRQDTSAEGLDREVRRALRDGLAARFALRVRTEVRERPAALLKVPARAVPAPGVRPARMPCRLTFGDHPDVDDTLPPCRAEIATTSIALDGVTMADLAAVLTKHGGLRMPVVDDTGLGTQRVDVRLRNDPTATPATTTTFPLTYTLPENLFTQAGLELVPGSRPAPVLVIERVERPDDD